MYTYMYINPNTHLCVDIILDVIESNGTRFHLYLCIIYQSRFMMYVTNAYYTYLHIITLLFISFVPET